MPPEAHVHAAIVSTIETRDSWIVATVTLLVMMMAFGAPLDHCGRA
jgi:hypothetical protein